MKKVDGYMVTSPYVVEGDMGLQEALDFMRECCIRHLPIVEDGRLSGLVSDRDLREALALEKASQLKLKDIMKTEVYAVHQTASIRDVLSDMAELKYGSAVVVNNQEEVIGIFTTTDALLLLIDLLDESSEGEFASVEEYFESWMPRPLEL